MCCAYFILAPLGPLTPVMGKPKHTTADTASTKDTYSTVHNIVRRINMYCYTGDKITNNKMRYSTYMTGY